LVDLGPLNFRWHDLTIGAVGHLVLCVVGYAASLLWRTPSSAAGSGPQMTLWRWLQQRKAPPDEAAARAPGT